VLESGRCPATQCQEEVECPFLSAEAMQDVDWVRRRVESEIAEFAERAAAFGRGSAQCDVFGI